MGEPTIKRIRIQDLTKTISEQALQNFARAALEANRKGEEKQDAQDLELKRKGRRNTMLKPTSIRPLPLHQNGMHEKIKYSIVKKTLVNVIFGCSDEYKESMGPKFECPVYEYKNRRKLTFFPITTDDAGDFLFTCVDCYHVYCVMTVLRNRLESVPVFKLEKLGEDKDPLRFSHYCAHWGALSAGQKIYFKEFHWQYKYDEHKIPEIAFKIGMFVKKMCSYDIKVAKYCQESDDGQDENSLLNYIQGLDYTLKDEPNANSFLECFKTLHEKEIKIDDQGRVHIEGSFEASQDSCMTDSQSSQCSNSSQKTGKRTVYAPPAATLSSIQSMQNASSLISEQLKNNSTAIENDSQTLRQEQTANDNLSNNLADLFTLQNLINGLGSNLDTQQTNLFPELDTSQFVAGLLMSTMTPVNNSQLQVLYDGLRPLVARYAPECLQQFIQIIHKIDRKMPSEFQTVKLNTVPQTRVLEPTTKIITTTTMPTQQIPGVKKILRRIVTTNSSGSSSNPITLTEEKPFIIHKKQS